MLFWSIKVVVLSLILIFVVHNLFTFFKSTLTTPKIKDLVNKPEEKYNDILQTIKNSKVNTPVSNSTPSEKKITQEDSMNMKHELQHFLSELTNKKKPDSNDFQAANLNTNNGVSYSSL